MASGVARSLRIPRETDHQVLPIPVRLLLVLLEAAHEPVPRLDALCDVWVVHLVEQAELAGDGVAHLGHLVTGRADLDELLVLDLVLLPLGLECLLGGELVGVVLVAGGAAGEVGLVLLALGVGQVGALVGVEGEAQPALEAAEVVAEDVGVLKGLRAKSATQQAPVNR